MLRATAFPLQDCDDDDGQDEGDGDAADLEGDEDELFSLSLLNESVRWFRFHFWRSIEHFPEQCCMRAEYLNVAGEVRRWVKCGEEQEQEKKRSGWEAGTICHEQQQLHGQLILFRARPLCLFGRTATYSRVRKAPRS